MCTQNIPIRKKNNNILKKKNPTKKYTNNYVLSYYKKNYWCIFLLNFFSWLRIFLLFFFIGIFCVHVLGSREDQAIQDGKRETT